MGKRVGLEVTVAVAEAVALCRIDMAGVYPITPQSHIAEHLSNLVADGVLDAMLAFEDASQAGRHQELASTCRQPAALPMNLRTGELDQ